MHLCHVPFQHIREKAIVANTQLSSTPLLAKANALRVGGSRVALGAY